MKTRTRVITGLVVGTALTIGAALPAAAGTAKPQTDGWAMEVSVPNYTWTKTSGCEEIPVEIETNGWGADWWDVDADVRNAKTGVNTSSLVDYGMTDDPESVDDYTWLTSIVLCDEDAPGTYIVDGTAYYGLDADYAAGAPGKESAALNTTFTLSKMSSTTTLDPVKSDGKSAVVSGKVVANSSIGQVGGVGHGKDAGELDAQIVPVADLVADLDFDGVTGAGTAAAQHGSSAQSCCGGTGTLEEGAAGNFIGHGCVPP